jgi:Zn-dependent protease/predicted transcriptional regulator
MGRRVRLGHVLGVDIAVDWTWVFTFVLAASTLLTVGERMLPTLPTGALTLLSGAAAIGLFASLVVHEIAHALVARACGVPVRRLTLFLFGGITDVERDPASPRSEAIAAAAAPLTNALIGAALLPLGAAFGGTERPLGLLLTWLGGANVGIAALNLLPAFPLDGGRLVRAAIWRATGNVERATRWAAWLGQVIGWTIVLLGVGLAFAGRDIGIALGMWTAFVGWFIASAAAQAYEGVVVQEALAGVDVARLMRRRFQALPADATVATATRVWSTEAGDMVPIVEGERFVGVVSVEALRSLPERRRPSTTLAELVREGDHEVTPRDPAARAYRHLVERDADRLPVVEGSRLVGVVERADIERWIATYVARSAPVVTKEH